MDDVDQWLSRWQEGRIGFHQDEANELLIRFWPRLIPEPSVSVLVPLCGKSRDMTWLHQRGHAVLGVELTKIACTAFFEEQGFPYVVESTGSHELYVGTGEAEGIRIFCGDLFTLPPQMVSTVGAWYHRAAIVALPPEIQRRYVDWLSVVLGSRSIGFMLTFDYPRGVRTGAPYPVGFADVQSLFQDTHEVVLLDEIDLGADNRWGLPWVKEPVIQLIRR